MLPAFCAFAAEGEQTEAISLSEDSVTIGVGETVKVLDFITDADKATNTYTYVVGNEDVAVIDSNTVVTGMGTGKTIVNIKREIVETPEVVEGEDPPQPIVRYITAKFVVNVKNAPESAKLNVKNIALGVGKTFKLDVKISGGYSRKRAFASSDAAVASVDKNGVITANKAGKATIAFATYNGVKAYCSVTVKNTQPVIKITAKNTKVQKGSDNHRITYKVTGGLKVTPKFTTGNGKVAKIDSNGYVTAKGKGKTYVNLKTNFDNISTRQAITVVDDALPLNVNSVQLALDMSNVKRVKYGKSVQGRNLEGFEIINKKTGKYSKTLFMDFAVHGFEDSYYRDGKVLVKEANAIIKYFATHSEELGKYRLVIVPCANPDGTIAGVNNQRACSTAFGRCTAKHVDMNRDFGAFRGLESRKLRNYIVKCNPNLYMNMHGWLNETLGTSKLSRIVNRNLGLPGYIGSYGADQGYLIGWVHNRLGIPSTLVEYRSPGSVSTKKDVKMIKAVIKAYK